MGARSEARHRESAGRSLTTGAMGDMEMLQQSPVRSVVLQRLTRLGCGTYFPFLVKSSCITHLNPKLPSCAKVPVTVTL